MIDKEFIRKKTLEIVIPASEKVFTFDAGDWTPAKLTDAIWAQCESGLIDYAYNCAIFNDLEIVQLPSEKEKKIFRVTFKR